MANTDYLSLSEQQFKDMYSKLIVMQHQMVLNIRCSKFDSSIQRRIQQLPINITVSVTNVN